MSRKYRHSGYQDSDREERDREKPRSSPNQNLTTEERIHRRSLRHAIDRQANQIVRCHGCGGNVQDLETINFDSVCPHCRAALHCCRACRSFDTSARWQCRAEIAEAVTDKLKPNACGEYKPQLVLDVTGRRSTTSSSGKASDPRAQFENLFKR